MITRTHGVSLIKLNLIFTLTSEDKKSGIIKKHKLSDRL